MFPENITTIAEKLFEDALEDFSEMDLIRKRFEEWKLQFGDTYREAYISLCIPKLVTPFVKLQLVTWNPLEVRKILDLCIESAQNVPLSLKAFKKKKDHMILAFTLVPRYARFSTIFNKSKR